ncbi:MAG: Na+/H+ antiporter subunit E [Candidatus Hydrogenedentota bacterium]
MRIVFDILVAMIVWAGTMGSFAPHQLLIGAAIGTVVLWLSDRLSVARAPVSTRLRPGKRALTAAALTIYFMKEVILGALQVAWAVVAVKDRTWPGIIALELDVRTPAEIGLLANVITLTPGTISLGLSDDRRVLYVHSMFSYNPESLKQSIKHGFEHRIIGLLR